MKSWDGGWMSAVAIARLLHVQSLRLDFRTLKLRNLSREYRGQHKRHELPWSPALFPSLGIGFLGLDPWSVSLVSVPCFSLLALNLVRCPW